MGVREVRWVLEGRVWVRGVLWDLGCDWGGVVGFEDCGDFGWRMLASLGGVWWGLVFLWLGECGRRGLVRLFLGWGQWWEGLGRSWGV